MKLTSEMLDETNGTIVLDPLDRNHIATARILSTRVLFVPKDSNNLLVWIVVDSSGKVYECVTYKRVQFLYEALTQYPMDGVVQITNPFFSTSGMRFTESSSVPLVTYPFAVEWKYTPLDEFVHSDKKCCITDEVRVVDLKVTGKLRYICSACAREVTSNKCEGKCYNGSGVDQEVEPRLAVVAQFKTKVGTTLISAFLSMISLYTLLNITEEQFVNEKLFKYNRILEIPEKCVRFWHAVLTVDRRKNPPIFSVERLLTKAELEVGIYEIESIPNDTPPPEKEIDVTTPPKKTRYSRTNK